MTNWQRAPVLFSSPSSRVPLRMDMDEPVDMIRTCKGTHEGVISHSLQTVNSKIALHVASAFDELPAFGGAREILSVGLNATPLGRLQISSKIGSLRGLLGGARVVTRPTSNSHAWRNPQHRHPSWLWPPCHYRTNSIRHTCPWY